MIATIFKFSVFEVFNIIKYNAFLRINISSISELLPYI